MVGYVRERVRLILLLSSFSLSLQPTKGACRFTGLGVPAFIRLEDGESGGINGIQCNAVHYFS